VERLATWALMGATAILLLNPVFLVASGIERDLEGWLRLGGAGINQNPFSFYLLVVMLLSAARFAVRGQTRYLVLAGMAALWMALTLTRITLGAALLGLTGLSLYGALINRNYRAAAAGLGLATLLGIALAPIVLARSFGYVPSAGELLQLAGDPVALFNAVNWQGRQLIWPVLMQAWASSPWIGLGMGASPSVLDSALPGLGILPHNEYLRLGVEAGWIGVTLFFLAIAAWLRMVLRAGRIGPPSAREHALPALAGTLAWAVIAVTDNAFDYYGAFTQFIAFFTAAACVSARAGSELEGATPEAPESRASLDPRPTGGVA
jgi:O-antigen ligase